MNILHITRSAFEKHLPHLMRQPLLVVAILCVLCATVVAQQQATVKRNANLRPTASAAEPPIELLTPSTTVSLLSRTKRNGYYHVQAPDGKKGWAFAKNVEVNTSRGAAPSAALSSAGGGTPHLAWPIRTRSNRAIRHALQRLPTVGRRRSGR